MNTRPHALPQTAFLLSRFLASIRYDFFAENLSPTLRALPLWPPQSLTRAGIQSAADGKFWLPCKGVGWKLKGTPMFALASL